MANTAGEIRTVLVIQEGADSSEATVFRHHMVGARILCVLFKNCRPIFKTGGGNLVDIEVENHEAVNLGELERNSEAIKVVKPKFNKERDHPRGGG